MPRIYAPVGPSVNKAEAPHIETKATAPVKEPAKKPSEKKDGGDR